MSDFSAAIRSNPAHGMAYFNRGSLSARAGRMAEACADMKKAASLGDKQAVEFIAAQCKQ